MSKSHNAIEVYANFVDHPHTSDSPSPCIVDFRSSHNFTKNIRSLQTQTKFSSTYAITVGHGKRIPITHIGPTTLSSPNFVGYFLL